MGLPGFIGDASLYRSSEQYCGVALAPAVTTGGIAFPQQFSFVRCYPPICIPGRWQWCCYGTPFGPHCWIRHCPPPLPCTPPDCVGCRTPAQACICAGGTWTGSVCI